MNIRIITDSGSDIIERYPGVTVLPLTITFGEQSYKDAVDLSHSEFYKKLSSVTTLPTTSQATPYDFGKAFEQAVNAGETVIAITLSSKLSGTYQSAVAAAAEYPDKVFVVDSLNVAIGQRALVAAAMQMVEDGVDAAQIVQSLNEIKGRIRVVALLDTLEYLKKGGRISATVAFAGGLLSIKPVVAVVDGAVAMLGKARGSRAGNNLLVEEIEKAGGIDFSMPYFLGYTGNDDTLLQQYMEDSRAIWEAHTTALPIKTIGGTIGTHVGPGAIAVAFFANKK